MKIRIVQTDYSEFRVQRLDDNRNIDFKFEWVDIRGKAKGCREKFETEEEARKFCERIKGGIIDKYGYFKEIVIEEYEI